MRIQILLLSLLVAGLALGCGEERDPINRVQPNAIAKSYFDGEWYYQRTVVDVPSANGFTFVGSSDFSGLSVIEFDIQEDMLLIRRNIELIEGGDDLQVTGDDYEGEVIAAFRISSHFDIQRAYNPMTGETQNILVENTTDRPWWEREYMRVDWSQNLVNDYRFDWASESVEPIPYFVQAEPDPETGEIPADAPLFEEDGSYFDITSRLYAAADTVYIEGFGDAPSCWLFGGEFDECGAGEYTIRHSFLRRDDTHQYIPQPYKGGETNLFGFFEASRMTYDMQEGIRQQNRERFLTRHNLWETWYPEDQADLPWEERDLLPASERTLRPIVYHVNREFPEDLKPIALAVGDQWNGVFNDVVTAMGYQLSEGERTFIVCPNNPIQEGDPAQCGEPGDSPRLGDIRYSFMAYVPKYMKYGLLGLGPSNNDPETGEIISGMAYVYHHNNTAAFDTAQMIELLNAGEGSLMYSEFIDGVDLDEWAAEVRGELEAAPRTFDLQQAEFMVDSIANGWMTQLWDGRRYELTEADVQYMTEEGFDAWAEPFFDRMYNEGVMNGTLSASEGRLRQLQGTYIEDLMMTEEHLLAAGRMPGTPVTHDHLAEVSPLRGGFGQLMIQRENLRMQFAERNNMYLPEMADDALMGMAREFAGREYEFEELYEAVRTRIYTAVLAHEVGHSLGLMHNFGGSDDAINYFDEYWQIRSADGTVAPRTEDPMTQAEIDANIYNYGYSSVMDYAGRYTVDGAGIGRYDRAAMLFGYGNMVEVFRDSSGVETADLNAWWDRDGDVLVGGGPLGIRTIHYTHWYNQMGERLYDQDNRLLVDLDLFEGNDFSQVTVDGATYDRVPYIYCSHNASDLSDHCLTRDSGADSMERMGLMLDDLNTWYILRNFPRGRIGVDTYNYVSRYYGRVFNKIKNWNNLYGLYVALFGQFFNEAQMTQFLTDSEEGFGAKTWAVQNAFNYLVQTIMMPNVADYAAPSQMMDGTTLAQENTGLFGRFSLGIDDARYYSTDWAGFGSGERECGYMWYECLHHIGFYFDKIMAMEALTDSSTNFVARATPTDIREWEVSYYSTFPEQIAAINEALMSQNYESVGPYFELEELQFPNYAGDLDERHDVPVDPNATFTIQLYWQVLGQARFPENFDREFRQESRIFEIGSGSAPDIDPERLVTFQDPESGITYGAIRYTDRTGAGAAMLERANCLYAESMYGTLDRDDPDFMDPYAMCPELSDIELLPSPDAAEYELRQYLELIQIMADLGPMMEYGDPYNP